EKVEIVQAITVDRAQVETQIAQLKAQEMAEKDAESTRQRQLQQQAESLKAQRVQEEKRLAELEKQQTEQQKRQAEEEKSAQEKLETLRQQQQQQAQKLVAQEKQQQIEAEREAEAARKVAAKEEAQARRVKQQQQRGEINRYKNLITQAISRSWIIPASADEDLSAQFEIRLAENGSVLEVRLLRSSGDPILDRSAETAIYKASPLPVPGDTEVFDQFKVLNLTVQPLIRG
ncbi:MAG: cell envelope integrity protein TolA, partial [Gammaproteobacteria bacterium]